MRLTSWVVWKKSRHKNNFHSDKPPSNEPEELQETHTAILKPFYIAHCYIAKLIYCYVATLLN